MLNDSEALQKVKRDVRMMTKTTEPDVERKCNEKEYLMAKYSGYIQLLHSRLQGNTDREASTKHLPKIEGVVFGQHVRPEDHEGNMILRALILASKSYYDIQNNKGKKKCIGIIRVLMEECGANFVLEEGKATDSSCIYKKIRQRLTDTKVIINLNQDLEKEFPELRSSTLSQWTEGLELNNPIGFDFKSYEELMDESDNRIEELIPETSHTLPYYLPYFVDSIDEAELLPLPLEITL